MCRRRRSVPWPSGVNVIDSEPGKIYEAIGWPDKVPPSELASVNYTWGRIVGRLKKHVETGETVPFFP